MRKPPHYWVSLLTKPGFKRKKRRSQFTANYNRNLRLEKCEDRCMLAITVDVFHDIFDLNDNDTTLREAIFSANQLNYPETIVFAATLDGVPILLTEGELDITNSVTIDAQGQDITIDAGNGTDNVFGTGDGTRVFSIDTGFDGAVTFAGLTITGGDTSGDGGGILHHGLGFGGSDLTIRDSVIRDNYAQGDGGGFLTRGSETEITIIDSVISGNQANAKIELFALAV